MQHGAFPLRSVYRKGGEPLGIKVLPHALHACIGSTWLDVSRCDAPGSMDCFLPRTDRPIRGCPERVEQGRDSTRGCFPMIIEMGLEQPSFTLPRDLTRGPFVEESGLSLCLQVLVSWSGQPTESF